MSLFFRSIEEQRSHLAPRIARWHPRFVTGGTYYRVFLRDTLKESSIVLDAGCGRGGILGEFRDIPEEIIGVDTDADALAKNPFVTRKIVADLSHIPLDTASVDVITAEFVFEHLDNPETAFQELVRVLKPGGSLVFLTPNLLNPVIAGSWALPHRIHRWFRSSVLHKKEQAHRTYYRMNTERAIRDLCENTGFRIASIRYAGNPEYLAFCKPLAIPAILVERLLDVRPFDRLKMYLVGHAVKLL